LNYLIRIFKGFRTNTPSISAISFKILYNFSKEDWYSWKWFYLHEIESWTYEIFDIYYYNFQIFISLIVIKFFHCNSYTNLKKYYLTIIILQCSLDNYSRNIHDCSFIEHYFPLEYTTILWIPFIRRIASLCILLGIVELSWLFSRIARSVDRTNVAIAIAQCLTYSLRPTRTISGARYRGWIQCIADDSERQQIQPTLA